MKILMTLDAVGGVWQHALDLGQGLRDQGASVVLAGLGPLPDARQMAMAQSLGPIEWGDAPLDWLARSPEELRPVAPWLDELAARHSPDVLHLNLPTQAMGLTCGLPVLAMSHSCLATWFAAVRGSDVPPDLAWHRDATANGLAAADLVVAPSQSHAEALCRSYDLRLAPMVVPNVSRAAPLPGPRRPCIVAVGRWWDAGKNGAVLDLAAKHCDWPVQMIGALDGPDGARLVLSHACPSGSLSHADTLQAIGQAGIFCAPSVYEPFGLAVLEAARAGVPLVLSDIPTFREIWDGAAVFFSPEDSGDLAATLNALAQDGGRRSNLGRAAQRRASRLTPRTQMDAMWDLYRQLVRASAPTHTATG